MLGHVVLDIPTDFNIRQSCSCCIYKVPPNLRKVNPEAYTPQLIARGPLHRKNPKLKPMETEKATYFHFFWQRYHPNAQELFQRYKSKLQEEEERIRHSYAVKLPKEYSKEKLVDMIFFDAVFIMEPLIRFSSWKSGKAKNCEENHDYMTTKIWLRKSILRDLLLLENQIPMFVLEELYHTSFAGPAANKSQTRSDFHKLAAEYFEELTGRCHGVSHKTNNGTKDSENLRHFTDMIRYLYRPKNPIFAGENEKSCPSILKTATQVKMKKVSS